MSFSEFLTHPNKYMNLVNTTQTTQIQYPQHRIKSSETDHVQQKQRKQLILTDSKNILTSRSQPIERLQPNFKTYGIRNFMYTKHDGENVKLRIFFHTATTTYTTQFYESYISNNQTNKHNPNNQNSDINVDFTTKTNFLLNFCRIHIQILQ